MNKELEDCNHENLLIPEGHRPGINGVNCLDCGAHLDKSFSHCCRGIVEEVEVNNLETYRAHCDICGKVTESANGFYCGEEIIPTQT